MPLRGREGEKEREGEERETREEMKKIVDLGERRWKVERSTVSLRKRSFGWGGAAGRLTPPSSFVQARTSWDHRSGADALAKTGTARRVPPRTPGPPFLRPGSLNVSGALAPALGARASTSRAPPPRRSLGGLSTGKLITLKWKDCVHVSSSFLSFPFPVPFVS